MVHSYTFTRASTLVRYCILPYVGLANQSTLYPSYTVYVNPKKEGEEREGLLRANCCRGQMLHNGLSPFTVAGMAVRDMDAVVYLAGVNAPSINLD